MLEIQLYNSLKGKLGDQETQEFINFVNSRVKNEFMDREEKLLTKDDKIEMMLATKADKMELINTMKADKMELINTMKADKMELINMMKKDTGDITRSIYLAGIVQFLAIIGALIPIVTYILKR